MPLAECFPLTSYVRGLLMSLGDDVQWFCSVVRWWISESEWFPSSMVSLLRSLAGRHIPLEIVFLETVSQWRCPVMSGHRSRSHKHAAIHRMGWMTRTHAACTCLVQHDGILFCINLVGGFLSGSPGFAPRLRPRPTLRLSVAPYPPTLQIHEHGEHFKRMNQDSLMHPPEFVIKPRSHTVWEKQCVRLHCTVSGWPDPRVVW